MLTHNELVFTFGGSYVCASFGENQSRNATVRVLADGQMQTSFIICPMLYAIAIGRVIKSVSGLIYCIVFGSWILENTVGYVAVSNIVCSISFLELKVNFTLVIELRIPENTQRE